MQSPARALWTVLPLCLALCAQAADEPPAAVDDLPLATDPVLGALVSSALSTRPELRRGKAAAQAEGTRISQSKALPDPVLSLGVQNDGFRTWQVGTSHTSWYEVGLSQSFPWPGKRRLRAGVAAQAHAQAEALVDRIRRTTEADVRRAYLALLLARDQRALLDELEALWRKAAETARIRYEAGDGPQSDVLRAQLEANRLRQRRWAIDADEQLQRQALNRLRGSDLDAPLTTSVSLRDLALPQLVSDEEAHAHAERFSPELAAARLGARRATARTALARRERMPDFNVSAMVMPRGDLDTMWKAGVAVGLPVWSAQKQQRALAESEARATVEAETAQALAQVLRQRVAERRVVLKALADTVNLYRQGLLVQSRATAESTLSQYKIGKVSFASVLDAYVGYLSDEQSYLVAVADAQRVAIARAEIALEPVRASILGGAAATMPSGGAMGADSATAASPATPASEAPSTLEMGM
ncbi:MAG: TolC family protein [Polyangiales bacterium]